MTIDFIVDLAYEHLLKNQYTGDQLRELVKQHAMEELALSEENAEALAWKEEPELQDEIDAASFRDFYLWYYFNWVAPPLIDEPKVDPLTADRPPVKGKYNLLLFAVIRVTAQVDDLRPDEAIAEWQSNCNYELASSDRLKVVETEIIGVTSDRTIR